MMKDKNPNVYLTINDDLYGFIHDNEKIYSFVEVAKKVNSYSFKNLDQNMYFSSKPLSSENYKNTFVANRVVAREWEEFDLEVVLLENSGFFSNFISFLKTYKNTDTVNLYWWRGKGFTNFGDELNLYIVSHLSNKKVKRVEKRQTDLVGIGSILNWFPKRKNTYEVWGSGTLGPTELLNDEDYNISLLRGPLTKSLLKKESIIPYGDPGILASTLWSKNPQQVHDWGIIVHFTQAKKPWVKKLIKNTPNSILIDVKNEDMADLMAQISSCKNIASTSLHGLIVADSYCIPNVWLWEGNLHRGGQWKFFDYFSGINRMYVDNVNPDDILSLSDVNPQISNFKYFNQIENIQNRVIKSFPLK
ncbi:polysaccharide pyruvyl transferase family protein [Psychrobacter sp. NG27]|uniref:polysaccharide pyruvyl transferase family protein n=1 Tax=Psychrobacter sp. NG27 TaxID=2781966 RepID=UPI0018E0203D|nr:polysaccharide pyruvyl transferase family protein [Psychrobacter sp. NG27]MBI0425842.1 polysaccharide pyruvyl transferase family protein [Psychrobacter sp. NG27]